ncbi:D-ribose pyranase [soil metagenome]
MKKTGVLNHRISEVIATMGHGDSVAIGDAGLPIPGHVERIDLAVAPGMPGLLDVVRVVATELQVEAIVLADELLDRNRELAAGIYDVFPGSELQTVSHDLFKARLVNAKAVVRTGECTPYANVILVSGVTF